MPIGRGHAALAVDAQEADPASQLVLTRRLIALRQASPALRLGDFERVAAPAGVLAFERRFEGDRVLGLFNLGETAAHWTPEGDWRLVTAVNGAALGVLPARSGLLATAR